MSKNRLTRLEERIERLVEGGFARLFAGHLHPRQVATQLARAMEDNARRDPGQHHPIAPDTYTVFINTHDYAALVADQPDLANALGTHLVDLAVRSGMRLGRFPTVILSPSVNVARQQVRVSAEHAPGPVKTEIGDAEALDAAPPPQNARLVLDDGREIALARPVVNVGRRIDNHVVLDDTRVSRRHAQLRLRQGRYVLFDLGSSRGITVNGQAVAECILQKGDRVSFGGVTAVYLEDPAEPFRQDTKVRGDA